MVVLPHDYRMVLVFQPVRDTHLWAKKHGVYGQGGNCMPACKDHLLYHTYIVHPYVHLHYFSYWCHSTPPSLTSGVHIWLNDFLRCKQAKACIVCFRHGLTLWWAKETELWGFYPNDTNIELFPNSLDHWIDTSDNYNMLINVISHWKDRMGEVVKYAVTWLQHPNGLSMLTNNNKCYLLK